MSALTTDATLELLTRAAELQATGGTLDSMARKLKLAEPELRKLLTGHRAEYRRALAVARRDAIEEAFFEAVFSARKFLRSDDEKVAERASASLFPHVRQPEPGPPPHPGGAGQGPRRPQDAGAIRRVRAGGRLLGVAARVAGRRADGPGVRAGGPAAGRRPAGKGVWSGGHSPPEPGRRAGRGGARRWAVPTLRR